MRFFLLLSVVIGLLCFTGCPELQNSTTESNSNSVFSRTNSSNAQQNPTPPFLTETDSNQLTNKKLTDKPNIGIFDVVLSPFRYNQKKLQKQPFGFFDNSFDTYFGWGEVKEGLEFDIMNQYGFLGKGRIVKFIKPNNNYDGYWEIEVIKNSLRDDIAELADTRMGELEAELPSIPAIGVFPSKSERKNSKSGNKIDTSEKARSERHIIYLNLPEEIRNNADVYGERGDLEYPNSWTDLDGDGKIDFVYIRVRCAEKPRSHCGKYLFLQNGKWLELPQIKGSN